MSFFRKTPKYCTNRLVTVQDVQSQVAAFKAMYEMGTSTSANNCTLGENFSAQWRKEVREGVINNVGDPVELDFFEKIAGGKTTDINATDYYVKSNCDIDYNIMAEADATGASPGAEVWFTLARNMHDGTGKYSYMAKGGQIYNYKDRQWVIVTEINQTVDYAHQVKVKPLTGDYQVKIRKGEKMMFTPVRLVGGMSCPEESATWKTNGYISKVQPFRIRKDWKIELELERPYQEVLQFAIMFDKDGRETDGWEYTAKIKMREDMKFGRNLLFFIANRVTNATVLGTEVDAKYAGFDGYLTQVRYGGGIVYDFDPTQGFDLNSDLDALMIYQESKKKTMEFIAMDGYRFRRSMERRSNVNFNNYAGACTFDTFKRMGEHTEADIKKMGIKSYEYGQFTIHFNKMSALTDSRTIGNYEFPDMAFLMPGTNVRDSKGQEVPAIEFLNPTGAVETGGYQEFERDMRVIDGCEYKKGYATQMLMMAVHSVDQHIILNPVKPY